MKHQCVKIDELKKIGYDRLDLWLRDENNVYVGRNGRATYGSGKNRITIGWQKSPYHNPYRVGEGDGKYTLDESLRLYARHVQDKQLDLEPLRGKNLGCFCKPNDLCHAKLLCHMLDPQKYTEHARYLDI